jgi:gliding motility-associated-like protein
MKSIYTILLLIFCKNYILQAQNLTVVATPTESFCSSDGQISIRASGGVPPYTYSFISSPSSVNRPPQASNIFALLPVGSYTVGVSDANNLKGSATVQVTGTYSEPTLSNVAFTGGAVVLTATGGRPPYRYAYSEDGGTNFTNPSNSNAFDCLRDGDYVFRIYDSCDNFYSAIQTVTNPSLDFTASCKNTAQGTSISMKATNEASAPYIYVVYLTSGDSVSSRTGEFRNLSDCRYTLGIYDKCERKITKPFECTDNPLQLKLSCSNASNGTANLVATGGQPPYQFVETTTTQSNTSGDFTGLPLGKTYSFEVTDNCGKKKQASVSPFRITDTAWVGCPFTGDVTIKTSQQVTSDTACTSGCATFSFNPVTFTCPTCPDPSPNVVNGAAKEASMFIYKNLPEGQYRIFVSNGCQDTASTIVTISKQLIPLTIVPDCKESQITVSVPSVGTLYIFQDSVGVGIDSNATGTFKIPYVGRFAMEARNASCLPNRVLITDFAKPSVKLIFQGCDSISAVPCPNVPNFTYVLRGATGILIDSNRTGIFAGLTKNTPYRLILYNPSFPDSIVNDFTTDKLPLLVTDSLTCSSVCLRFNPATWANQGGRAVQFLLRDATGNIVATNSTGCFSNLRFGTPYTGEAVHPTCGMSSVSLQTLPGVNGGYCVSPSISTINGKCAFGWNVVFKPFANVYTLENNAKTVRLTNKTGVFSNLAPDRYLLITECSRDSIILPESGLNLIASAGIACPNAATVRASGARTDSAWVAWGKARNLEICVSGSETYELRDLNGTLVVANSTGSFTGLPSATPYIVNLVRGGCAIDTAKVITNLYERGELFTTFGVICPPATTGSIRAIVVGGNAPYTYEITSPRGIAPPIVTDSMNVLFTNLVGGNYVFRVSDKCGISSNLTGTVSNFNFIPQYRRICGGIIELQVPTIDSATYVWRNATNQVVGTNAPRIRVADRVANRYTVDIISQGCNYTTSVDIPAQTKPDLVAQAGTDRVIAGATAKLQADTIEAGVSGRWKQVLPSSGVTTFTLPTNPKSDVTVTQVPGRYTYVWEINGGDGSCTSSDTVIYTFCPSISTYNIAVTASLTRCDSNTGTIKLKAESSSKEALSYKWSTGQTTADLDKLAAGNYVVTVSDNLTCSQPEIRTVTIKQPDLILASTKNDIRCFGEKNGRISTKIQSTVGKYQIKWSNGTTDSVLKNLNGGQYIITVTDTLNCAKSDTVNIIEPAEWQLEASKDTILAVGDTLQLTAVIVSASQPKIVWNWSPSEFLRCNDCVNPTIYNLRESQLFRVIATDSVGCSRRKDIKILVDQTTGIFVPTAFSPNGDGTNDYFTLFAKTRIKTISRLLIFNRWGDKVFETAGILPNEEQQGWNGTMNGKTLAPDVFMYWAEVVYANGLTYIMKGDVTLMR